jgi:hypothetical protein
VETLKRSRALRRLAAATARHRHAALGDPSSRYYSSEGKRNGNYRHGGRTKEIIEVWKLIKSLR